MENESSHSGRAKKISTSWLGIIIALVVLIIIGISIAYTNHKINNTSSLTASGITSKKPFSAAVNSNVPLVISINTRAQGDNTGSNTIVQSDGEGNYENITLTGGKQNITIYTADAFYDCNSPTSPCTKYPNTDINNPSYGPSGFTYTPGKIKTLKATALYQDQQKCPVGTGNCDVWLYGPNKNIDMKLFYVNTASKNIVMVIDTGHFGSTQIVTHIAYDYKDVSIVAPTNYTNAPVQTH